MAKLNCWEAAKCGRVPGGSKEGELGVCPAVTNTILDGINDGKNGGRACWAIEGTYCKGKIQGSFATKYSQCKKCSFYHLVKQEEGTKWQNAKIILDRLDHVA
jgi:hypothetical protein